jgi:hypothetical protein
MALPRRRGSPIFAGLNYVLSLYPEATRQSSNKSSDFRSVSLKAGAGGAPFRPDPLLRLDSNTSQRFHWPKAGWGLRRIDR